MEVQQVEPAPPLGRRVLLQPWSLVADMKARLKELVLPIYGDKDTLWGRLVEGERREEARLAVVEEAQKRQQSMRDG
jgi:hypothetical protein